MKTIDNLAAKTGYVGPHTFYALPGRMLIGRLSNTADQGGVTGMVAVQQQGRLRRQVRHADAARSSGKGDGYGYDIAVNPAKNALLTSSFTGWNNYMRDLGEAHRRIPRR